ncbi:MAG: OmpA family protein [Gammaproteobacteria bacterium]
MKQVQRMAMLAALWVATASAGAAEMPERGLGLLLGGGWADENLVGGKDGEVNPLFGLRYGQRLRDDINFFGDLVYGSYDGNLVGDADLTTVRGGLEWLISRQQRYNWFLSGGFGLMNVDTDSGPDFTRPMASLGVGQDWAVGVNDAFRWELRADQSFGNSSLPNGGLTNVQALLGYSWGLGAPADTDGDGVPNRLDQCPNTPKGAKVDAKGCPLDSDGDGVFDGLDQCPNTPAGVKVDGKGCPVDSDGDGVPDHKDKCPTVPAPGTADGCPPDSDGDGVIDAKDACPAVPAPGTVDGCPPKVEEPAPAPRTLTLEGVNFDNDSAKLRSDAIAILDAAAATLKEWGEVKVEVAGHTDSVNSDAYNQDLSQRRADAVRAYLVDKGIAAERLTAKGYGEANPVADNDSAEGRARNRRVELVPQQ